DFDAMRALRQVGYATDDPAAAIRAYHLHFRGMDTTTLDAEDADILQSLTDDAEERLSADRYRQGIEVK
ncbi:MAG: hypothetical protein ABJA62_07465, partial [Luteimonas sp.]